MFGEGGGARSSGAHWNFTVITQRVTFWRRSTRSFSNREKASVLYSLKRVALGVAAKADHLAQVIQVLQVLAPDHVDHLKQKRSSRGRASAPAPISVSR